MASHYQHPVVTRRDRAIERLAEILTRIVELLIEFWRATEPGDHADGATDRYADFLGNLPDPDDHDQLAADTGRYHQLLTALVISGDPELTDIDGWRLTGSLLDSLPGA